MSTRRRERVGGSPQAATGGGLRPSLWLWLALALAVAALTVGLALQYTTGLADGVVGAIALVAIGVVVIASLLGQRDVRSGGRGRRGWEDEVRDPLTGLPTFQAFSQVLLDEFERVRHQGGETALIVIDINHLSQTNERYGTDAGDSVLRRVTQALEDTKRANDTIARLGDDEFAMLLPDCDAAGAQAFIERLQDHLSRDSITLKEGDRSASIWIGICAGKAACDASMLDADEVLTAAVADLNASREARDRRRALWESTA